MKILKHFYFHASPVLAQTYKMWLVKLCGNFEQQKLYIYRDKISGNLIQDISVCDKGTQELVARHNMTRTQALVRIPNT